MIFFFSFSLRSCYAMIKVKFKSIYHDRFAFYRCVSFFFVSFRLIINYVQCPFTCFNIFSTIVFVRLKWKCLRRHTRWPTIGQTRTIILWNSKNTKWNEKKKKTKIQYLFGMECVHSCFFFVITYQLEYLLYFLYTYIPRYTIVLLYM